MSALLPILFLFVAWLYAMAGFGGGSTYIALLAISGLPLAAIPIVALSCNLIVSAQGSILLIRRGFAEWRILRPLLIASIPCAFIGGAWRLPESAFLVLLAVALTLASGAMILQNILEKDGQDVVQAPRAGLLIGVGILLGFLAGITGIGGGIYLAPIMHLCGWARAQTIAACTSMFIALNSFAGLMGQLTKGERLLDSLPVMVLIACPIAVLVGGRVGTYLLTNKLPRARVRFVTAMVILLVAIRLWLKVLIT
ncbi:MAG: sulfite exporter TauE/SafE family protein [Opitutales bacterium]|nr:sulfite exporter TauE/SafE family protein [Opitutales bacterium]MDP4694158.1 sulfite exporter TauE/SafE family protein [Opitutales bacterium]MDP4777722.1 sulfite exporter TauE/SafE family protein [Opitutales bacterium]MDP4879174.1 sulfite exporter TauE/SafE family protein [Opitutales bacterium]MDP4884108.1 sulfite exporter TauE/SafE family protein [Opitutales bacterium]